MMSRGWHGIVALLVLPFLVSACSGLNTDAGERLAASPTELRLAPGDTILLHTDGIPEARNSEREMYGLERLRLALERNAHLGVDEVRDRVMHDARSFMAEQKDDLTLVVLRYS